MQLILIGTSYKTAPMKFRENIYFTEPEIKESLNDLIEDDYINEVLILSTCNRTEFYIITPDLDLAAEALSNYLQKKKGIDFENSRSNFYVYFNKFATEHLYRVSCGLDSLVIGESEVLGQVKSAFAIASKESVTGKLLNILFKFAVETGKRARSETDLTNKQLSFGALITKLSRNKYAKEITDKSVFLIGAGEIGTNTAKNLKSNGIKNLTIINKTLSKAKNLAETLGGDYIPFEKMTDNLPEADIIITCTEAGKALIHNDNYTTDKDALLVDLSIPRNIAKDVSEHENIEFHDLDSLSKIIENNKEELSELIKDVECIIAEELNRFIEWHNSLNVLPVVSTLSNLFKEVKDREINKFAKKNPLSDKEKEYLDKVSNTIINKILAYPAMNLKVEEDKQLQEKYIESLIYLFQLDEVDIHQRYFRKKFNKSEFVKLS